MMSEIDLLSRPEVVLLLPAYNEAERSNAAPEGCGLEASIGKYLLALSQEYQSYQVWVIDDGSTDTTAELAINAGASLLSYADNQGRGYALRRGFTEIPAQYATAYTDADGSYPADTIKRLFEQVATNVADVAVAYRKSSDGVGLARAIGHHGMHSVCEVIARTDARDPQAGAKAFQAQIAPELWDQVTSSGWAADREVLYLARKFGLSVSEIGSDITDVGDSRVKLIKDAIRMVRDSTKIRRQHHANLAMPATDQAGNSG